MTFGAYKDSVIGWIPRPALALVLMGRGSQPIILHRSTGNTVDRSTTIGSRVPAPPAPALLTPKFLESKRMTFGQY